MADHVILLQPSANRVYAGENARLSAAELSIMLGGSRAPLVEPLTLAGVDYLRLELDALDATAAQAVSRLSSRLAVFRREGEALLPVAVPAGSEFDDDLLTIPKYPGKTNEQFTRLLLNVSLASTDRPLTADAVVLDPLCGRGTTCSAALGLGLDAAGVEADLKAVEAYATFLRTYLRRKRLKHHVEVSPVRRDGKSVGRRLEVSVTPSGAAERTVSILTGDARDSAKLWGRRRFDAIVTDAPYGVVHASRSAQHPKERSAATLLADCLPVWAGQLKTGGVLGLSWNTYAVTREHLVDLVAATGLSVRNDGPYGRLAHRVDSAIHRDVLVAVRP